MQRPAVHVSAGELHAVPAAHVPPQPSLGVSPHGRVEGGEHVGAQQLPLRQRSPEGQRVPFGHIAQPAGSVGSVPQSSVEGAAQVGQQLPPVHVVPAAHIVPSPHMRHTRPIASR